jgi:hypothetical protein
MLSNCDVVDSPYTWQSSIAQIFILKYNSLEMLTLNYNIAKN